MPNTVEQRHDGWYVIYSDRSGCSGPWKTKESADLAAKGLYKAAHLAEGDDRIVRGW